MFVSRKFPPSVGGMETLAAGVWRSIAAVRPDAVLMAHRGQNKALVWWVPLVVVRVLGRLLRRDVGVVLTGDALMHAVLRPMLAVFRVPCATMVMGLDVTYPNPLYRAFVLPQLRNAAHVISISRATAERVVEAGVLPDRVSVVRLGVPVPDASPAGRVLAAQEIRDRVGLAPESMVLVTVGRLVKRKGVAWFVTQVMPHLPENVCYVVAGDGPDRESIQRAVRAAGVHERVHLLGRVDDELKEALLTGADLFVQPNVRVPGDMEGFGLVNVEAALRGTPVVAADLEGIREAVVPGKTGILLPTADRDAWRSTVLRLVEDRRALERLGGEFQVCAATLYSEEVMAHNLRDLLSL